MTLQQRIRNRVLGRARQYLQPRQIRLVPVNQIVRKLVATLPGDVSDYHIDHHRPLIGFDLTDDSQVLEAFSVDNHRWLRAGANLRKGPRE